MTIPLAVLQYPDINPVLFHLGPISVRWYGIAYLMGFALAYLLLRWMERRKQLPISMVQLSDLLTWLILGVLVGGRMGWWIFYHHNIKGPEPWYEPIAIWHGGMSFHGGLTGVAIALFIWARINRVHFWPVADCLALVTPIGLFLGRLANFVNAELVGRPTSLPWGMIFPGDTIPPSIAALRSLPGRPAAVRRALDHLAMGQTPSRPDSAPVPHLLWCIPLRRRVYPPA